MKFKQIFFTVAISAVTALAVIWGYGTYVKNSNTYAGQQAGVMPANYKYAGLFDGNTAPPGSPIDFTAPAEAATPAVVHIKTKTNAKQVSNNLPRAQRDPFGDLFNDDFFGQF
ncbi:MAG: serine protease, partial [Ferruginibacter sp.]